MHCPVRHEHAGDRLPVAAAAALALPLDLRQVVMNPSASHRLLAVANLVALVVLSCCRQAAHSGLAPAAPKPGSTEAYI
jgi:hypothetical protein